MAEDKLDKELIAINQIIKALELLDPGARKRVLDYTLTRLGVGHSLMAKGPLKEQEILAPTSTIPTLEQRQFSNIRSLRDEKNPKTAIQMTALVAYYLQEVAPQADRKEEITSDDLTKYFKQANFQLPKGKAIYTLRNARNAGYFDAGSGTGAYKLNPVGYNLVVHGLPSKGGKATKKAKKSGKKKK